jgi:hypothetical protein
VHRRVLADNGETHRRLHPAIPKLLPF